MPNRLETAQACDIKTGRKALALIRRNWRGLYELEGMEGIRFVGIQREALVHGMQLLSKLERDIRDSVADMEASKPDGWRYPNVGGWAREAALKILRGDTLPKDKGGRGG